MLRLVLFTFVDVNCRFIISTRIIFNIQISVDKEKNIRMAGGRPTSFTKQKKDQIFSEYLKVFRENKKVPSKTDGIWVEIKKSHSLPQAVTPAAIYTAMLNKYNALLLEEETAHQSKKSKQSKDESKLNQSNDSNELDDDSDSDSNNERENFHFNVKLPINVWDTIKPKDVSYSRTDEDDDGRKKSHWRTVTRTYQVLKSGVWTYTLSRLIAEQKKQIQCRWAFKRCKVYPSETADNYITVHGYCVTCKAELKGCVHKMPEFDARFIQFDMNVLRFDSLQHHEHKIQKNVKISREQSESMYASIDSYGQAARVQRQLLRDSVDTLFQAPVARVPTQNAIRCAQYRSRKMKQVDECPKKALELLKMTFYKDWIQSIGGMPFHVSYVNTETIILYNIYKKKNGTTTIICDSTGEIARHIGEYSTSIY